MENFQIGHCGCVGAIAAPRNLVKPRKEESRGTLINFEDSDLNPIKSSDFDPNEVGILVLFYFFLM